jgi:metallo-beta-lactamase class B
MFASIADFLLLSAAVAAAEPVLPQAEAHDTEASWRQPVRPFALADHSWYVGTEGLSAVLVKTPKGAVLIDGGLPRTCSCATCRSWACSPATSN